MNCYPGVPRALYNVIYLVFGLFSVIKPEGTCCFERGSKKERVAGVTSQIKSLSILCSKHSEPGMKAGMMSGRSPATYSEATEGCRGHGVERCHGK